MKKRTLVDVYIIFLLLIAGTLVFGEINVPVLEGTPPTAGGGPAQGTVKLKEGIYVPESVVGKILNAQKCSEGGTNCWEIRDNEVFTKGTVNFHSNTGTTPNGLRDKDGNIYSDNGMIKIGTGGQVSKLNAVGSAYDDISGLIVPSATFAGKPTLLGGQPVIPLKGGRVNVAGVEMDKATYQRLETLAGNNPVTKGEDNKLEFGGNSLEVKRENNIQRATVVIKDDGNVAQEKSGTTWTLPDGTTIAQTGADKKRGIVTIDGEEYTVASDFNGLGELKVGDKKEMNIHQEGNAIVIEDQFDKTGQLHHKRTVSDDGRFTEERWDAAGKMTERSGIDARGRYQQVQFRDPDAAKPEATFTRYLDNNGRVKYLVYPNDNKQYVLDEDGDVATWLDNNGDNKKDAAEVKKLSDNELKRLNEGGKDVGSDWRRFRGQSAGLADIGVGLVHLVDALGQRYDALTRLLGLNVEWFENADREFAAFRGKEFFSSLMCKNALDFTPPEGMGMITAPSGEVQAVASIQAERSPGKLIILCNEEAEEEEEQCPEDYTCQDDICYDKNGKKAEAYLYKITWGVQAPNDVAFTPVRDEKGGKISFNIKVGNTWLYEWEGRHEGAISIRNGEHDGDVRLHYSLKEGIEKACIIWKDAPLTIGNDPLPDVCYDDIEPSAVGQVKWAEEAESTSEPTHRVSGGEVQARTGFLE